MHKRAHIQEPMRFMSTFKECRVYRYIRTIVNTKEWIATCSPLAALLLSRAGGGGWNPWEGGGVMMMEE